MLRCFLILFLATFALRELRAEIPWPEVDKRLAEENAKLANRPQGHAGEYFVVCTLYYTPMESGFTFARGFDATPVTISGLRRHKYARDFLRAVKREGIGRIITPVYGYQYIRYYHGAYAFVSQPSGGGSALVPRSSAAIRLGPRGFRRSAVIELSSPAVKETFGNNRWKMVDGGGGLRRWQVDLYFGEAEPLGPDRQMARPRGTTFEYAYSNARITE